MKKNLFRIILTVAFIMAAWIWGSIVFCSWLASFGLASLSGVYVLWKAIPLSHDDLVAYSCAY